MKQPKSESGFTLIEIIVVLVLLSIMSIVLSNTIMYVTQSFIFARDADQLSQKAQLAMARLNREFTNVQSISSSSANQIVYTSSSDGQQYTILMANNQITLQGTNQAWPLIDGVSANNGGTGFLTYFVANGGNWSVESNNTINQLSQINVAIALNVQNSGPLRFNTTINPRNSNVPVAPSLN
jgi:prepilin-type N-terminal cleavage/methylation domain-containing protein